MSTVYLYRIYCIEEGIYVESWGTSSPTLCPNNHGDRTIDSNRTVVINTLSQNTVKVLDPTDGWFQSTTIKVPVPSGNTGDYYYQDYSWPMDTYMWRTEFVAVPDMIGDEISIIAAPETIIGYLTNTANIGATLLNVSSTVVPNVLRGFEIVLDTGATGGKEDLKRIVAIDKVNNTITVETPTGQSFPPGTLIKLNIYMVKDYSIDNATHKNTYGTKGFRGKNVPANIQMRIKYKNNNTIAKEFCWKVEFFIQQ